MDEGRILQTGADLNPLEGEEVMDVSGCLVAPGGIDAHTHFDMPCGSIMTVSYTHLDVYKRQLHEGGRAAQVLGQVLEAVVPVASGNQAYGVFKNKIMYIERV